MMKRIRKRSKTTGLALTLILCLLLTGCLFGGREEGTQSAQEPGSSAETATKEQPAQTEAAPQTTEETTPENHTGPVTEEDVKADLTEAFGALTGTEGAKDAHLLGMGGKPLTGFSYEGGAAIMAPYVKIETKSVTGQDDRAQAQLTITSPDLYPLIEKAVEGMENFDEEMMNQNLEDLLKAGGYAETAYDVTVDLVCLEGTWYIDQNEDLQNALSGGLMALEKAAAPTAGGKD